MRCSAPATESTAALAPPSIFHSAARRFCSPPRETASLSTKVKSRVSSVTTASSSMTGRSRAKLSALASSGQITTSGRAVRPRSAAARLARWTAPPTGRGGRRLPDAAVFDQRGCSCKGIIASRRCKINRVCTCFDIFPARETVPFLFAREKGKRRPPDAREKNGAGTSPALAFFYSSFFFTGRRSIIFAIAPGVRQRV